jgi:hypothetical protein
MKRPKTHIFTGVLWVSHGTNALFAGRLKGSSKVVGERVFFLLIQ